ncbi:MAG TPA: DUF2911 domain-containing protein [Ohtaekwangia sp.]|nr:DUF2911 domain-containing protein [Ohtaekwangia sp.]
MKIIHTLYFFLLSGIVQAQLHLPELSPRSYLKQEVGYTNITISYGRPATRGRVVMGEVVPYNTLWRTGAGEGTQISFDRPVTIAGKKIPAGTYAFVTIPDRDQWTVLLNTDTSKIYGDPAEYDLKFEALRFSVTPQKSSRFYESLTIDLDITNYNADLYLSWENTQIHFPILTHTDEEALKHIALSLEKNPGNDEMYAAAAYYYFVNQKDPDQALQFINNALSIKEDRWYYLQKIDLLIRLKNHSEAIVLTEKTIEFLRRTKPIEWEHTVKSIEAKRNSWPHK